MFLSKSIGLQEEEGFVAQKKQIYSLVVVIVDEVDLDLKSKIQQQREGTLFLIMHFMI